MENLSIGTYSISNDGVSINYSAPAILPAEMSKEISYEGLQEMEQEADNKFTNFDLSSKEDISIKDEVTHKQYFGENIKRAINTFKPK